MRIVVISPEGADEREIPAMEGFFAAGLERYHVRKPAWTAAELEAWIRSLPVGWRTKLMLHQHYPLVPVLGLGGCHEKGTSQRAQGMSRSCHDLQALKRYLATFQQVMFGPVFPSISKKGYGPTGDFPWEEMKMVLASRDPGRSAQVLAIGGVTAEGLSRCHGVGFDGAAIMGAVWGESDPVRAFTKILEAAGTVEASPHAA